MLQSRFPLGEGSFFTCDGQLTRILDSSTGRMMVALESRPVYLGTEDRVELVHLGSEQALLHDLSPLPILLPRLVAKYCTNIVS